MIKKGQIVRIVKNLRFGEAQKGQIGEISDVLNRKSLNEAEIDDKTAIFLVHLENGKKLWILGGEIEIWNQLSLF